jgi:hypothetical protein
VRSALVSTWERAFPLLAFALMGTLLFVGRQALTDGDSPLLELTVHVEPEATPGDVTQRTNEALLLSYAFRSGYVHNDSAVRDRLIRNVQFVDDTLTRVSALDEAIRLNMHRTDPVARERLIWLASEALASGIDTSPSDEALESYMAEHESRFQRSATLSFEQVFVSRQRPKEDLKRRVRHVQVRLKNAEGTTEGTTEALSSDPGLLPRQMLRASPARIDARFGKGFAARLQKVAKSGLGSGWSEPIESTFGVHFVRVTGNAPARVPTLGDVRDRVTHAYRADTREDRVRAALSRLRRSYRIHIEVRS